MTLWPYHKRRSPALLLLIAALLWGPIGSGQDRKENAPLTRILFVFDASNSMNATWEKSSKIRVARRLLSGAMDSLSDRSGIQLGLRVYGHQTLVKEGQQDCQDTELMVPFQENNGARIKRSIQNIEPKGTTPIAYSLQQAADDFPDCADCRNIIVLITDGIEACDGDPCAVSAALQKKGVVLKPFVIGIGLDEHLTESFQCVGKFYDASNRSTFRKVLNIVVSQALNPTTAQVNLLNVNDRPKETNVPVTIYDRRTGKVKHQFIHTLNYRGFPDTLNIDPSLTYRVVAHTTPPVENDSVNLTPGQHNIIPVKAPQGYLEIQTKERSQQDIQCIVRKKDNSSTVRAQKVNERKQYRVGEYRVEVLTKPRIQRRVNVSQNHTTTMEIPEPGAVNIKYSSSGYGGIFRKEDKEWKKVCDLKENVSHERFLLLPGKYRLVFRSRNARETMLSKTKEFRVKPGRSRSLDL